MGSVRPVGSIPHPPVVGEGAVSDADCRDGCRCGRDLSVDRLSRSEKLTIWLGECLSLYRRSICYRAVLVSLIE